jgi:hypothetical protein
MVGEIGVNDYTYAFFQGKIMEEVKNMVPDVVQAIKDAVTVRSLVPYMISEVLGLSSNVNSCCCRELLVMALDAWLSLEMSQ